METLPLHAGVMSDKDWLSRLTANEQIDFLRTGFRSPSFDDRGCVIADSRVCHRRVIIAG